MNKTPDFAVSGNDPNLTNNSKLILTNNNITNITSFTTNNNNTNNAIDTGKKSITSNSKIKIHPLKLNSNQDSQGPLKHSNSLMNMQSKSNISGLSRKMNVEEKNNNNNKKNNVENSFYSTSGILANSNPFGTNIAGNGSKDFGSKFNTNNNINVNSNNNSNYSSGFLNGNSNSNFNNKSNERNLSPVNTKVNSEKIQIKKLRIKDNNMNNQLSNLNNNENNEINYNSGSLSDKRIEVVNYSKIKNLNEEENGIGNKRVLSDNLSKLFNSNKEGNNNNNNLNSINKFGANLAKNTTNSLNNNSNFYNNSLNNNSNFIKSSKSISIDNNLSNQIKNKTHVKKVAHRSLAGKTENGSTKTNQDNFVIMENILNCEDYKIYGVFDGHGKYFNCI